MSVTTPVSLLRIGELSRLCGVSTHLLRVWEQRYGLLDPVRSTGGYRLYSTRDLARVTHLLELRSAGLAVSSAAKEVLAAERAHTKTGHATGAQRDNVVAELIAAVREFDEAGVQALLDARLRTYQFEEILQHDLVPFLRELGEGWERGDISVAHEHFATGLIRRRLAAYTLCWGTSVGPRAVLACPPGELHDLLLYAFGVVLGRRGWQVRFLGADTPLDAVALAAEANDIVVLACSRRVGLIDQMPGLRELAANHTLVLAGAGADSALATDVGATLLPVDVVIAAEVLGRL